MINLETKLFQILTQEAIRCCSRALWLYLCKCIWPSYWTYINGFCKEKVCGTVRVI